MKSKILASLVFGLVILFSGVNTAFSFGPGKMGDSLEAKFHEKVMMILSNQDELGLTAEQLQKVKDLKINLKKELIQTNADIEIISLDINSEMMNDTINLETVNSLVDKKYDLKKSKTKSIIAACADLKNILTSQQKDKLKEIWKNEKKEMMGNMKNCPMMGKMMKSKMQ